MKLLVYDTSSDILSVGVYDGEKKLAGRESGLFAGHSSHLVPILRRTLREAKLLWETIDAVVVGLGPGSFTGLRVGVTTAKVLAYALHAKTVGVSSLEAIAYGVKNRERRIGVLLDARKGKVYAALYERAGHGFRAVKRPALVTREAFLKGAGKSAFLVENAFPTADGVRRAAQALLLKKKFQDPFRLEPLYLHSRDCNTQPRRRQD